MTGEITATGSGGARREPDVVRRWVAPVGLAIAVLAALTDPTSWPRVAVLAVPVFALGLAVRGPQLPTPPLTVGVILGVGFSQSTGRLEPAMFLISLLALLVAAREDSPVRAGLACGIATATPLSIAALQPADNHLAWGIWTIGVAFPAAFGRGLHRQEKLVAALDLARRQLALQAQADERRRVAREVHDLVGHGLAAVVLQVTSARHVLGRDAALADEALAAAEEVGRRSMRDLRATLTLLRSANDPAEAAPLPDLAELRGLVEAARRDGQRVSYEARGDIAGVDSAVGLALFRIAEEALSNAARHAPRADNVVAAVVTETAVALEVDTIGPLAPPTDAGRPRYGLVGMRERAATVGGELEAGPTPDGWRVSCRVPVGAR